MKKLKWRQYGVFIVSATGWLAIDLLTKYYFLNAGIHRIVLLDNFFYLNLQKNTGIAFGIQLGHSIQIIASIIILGLLTVSFLLYLLF